MVISYSSYEYNLSTGGYSDMNGCFKWIFFNYVIFQTNISSVFTEVYPCASSCSDESVNVYYSQGI